MFCDSTKKHLILSFVQLGRAPLVAFKALQVKTATRAQVTDKSPMTYFVIVRLNVSVEKRRLCLLPHLAPQGFAIPVEPNEQISDGEAFADQGRVQEGKAHFYFF